MQVFSLEAVLKLRDDLSVGMLAAAKNAEAAAKRIDALGASATRVGAGLTAVTVPLLAAGAAAVVFSRDLSKSMSEVATLIPGSTKRVEELRDAVQELSVAHGKDVQDLVGGLYQTISAFGDEAGQTVKILEINSKAATAGVASTMDAINLTSAVTKGYGDVTAEAVQHASDLAFVTVKLGQTTFPELAASMGRVIPIAATLGVTQEELFAGFATLTGVTGNASEVSTQMAAILRAMLKPTDDMTAAIQKLGFETSAAMLAENGLKGSLDLLIGTTDGTKEAVAGLFGRAEALTSVFALTGEQADTFNTKLGEMGVAAGMTDTAFGEITEGVNAAGFAFEQASQRAQKMLRGLGDSLVPLLAKMLNAMEPLISVAETLVDWFGKLPGPMQEMALAFVAMGAAIGPLLLVAGMLASSFSALIPLFLALGASATTVGAATAVAAPGMAGMGIAATGAATGTTLFSAALGTLAIALGTVLAALAVFAISYKATAALMEATGGTDAVAGAINWFRDIDTAALAAGKTFDEDWTPAQRAAWEATVATSDAVLAQEKALEKLVGAEAAASAKLEDRVKAAIKATAESNTLAEASDLLGTEITDLSVAQEALAIAAAQSEAADRAMAEQAARTEAALRMEEMAVKAIAFAEAERVRQAISMGSLAQAQGNALHESRIKALQAEKAAIDAANKALLGGPTLGGALTAEDVGLGGDVFASALTGTERLNIALQGTTLLAGMLGDNFAQVPDIIGNIAKSFAEAEGDADKFMAIASGVGQIGGLIGGKAGGAISGAAGGAMAGFSIGGPLGAVAGGIIGGIGGLFGGGGPSKEEIEAQRQELLAGTLSELETLAGRIDEIFSQKLTAGIGGISALYSHLADSTDVTQERFDALGMAGVAMFEELKAQGATTVEAMRAMGPALEQALRAAKEHGLELSGTIGMLADFQQKVADNEGLVNAAEGMGAVFDALRATGNLTQEVFEGLAGETQTLFDDLIAQGFTANQALALIAPTLHQMEQAAKDGLIALDPVTQELIDQAHASGAMDNMVDPMAELVEIQGLMLEAIGALTQAFGAELPAAVEKYIAKLNEIPTVPGVGGGELPPGSQAGPPAVPPGGGVPEFANEGFVASSRGGSVIRVGEGGQGEHVLKDSTLRDMLAGAGAKIDMGGISINLSGGGGNTQEMANQLAEALEQEVIPRLDSALREKIQAHTVGG